MSRTDPAIFLEFGYEIMESWEFTTRPMNWDNAIISTYQYRKLELKKTMLRSRNGILSDKGITEFTQQIFDQLESLYFS